MEDLRKRVSDLSNTVELMNRHVVDFSARLQASGLSESQITELGDLSLRLEVLVRDARDPADDALPTPPALAAAKPTPAATISVSREPEDTMTVSAVIASQVRNVPTWMDQSAVSSAANRLEPSPLDLGMGYSLMPAGGEETVMELEALSRDLGPLFTHSPPASGASPEKITFSTAFFDDDFAPFPVPTPQPSPPRTFSFQESTFARRLHRACLERAYQLLLEPDTRPATYERVFRLSLLGRSRAKILNVIKLVLARGPHQDLDFWEAPSIHVGGAGTHYPARDA